LVIGQELLALGEEEQRALRSAGEFNAFGFCGARRSLLDRLAESVGSLRNQRMAWNDLSQQERARQPEVSALVRRNQDLWMRVLVLDRENEQLLLRRGLVPAAHLPSAGRQQPHFVADLYRRSAAR
jgi:hypothetical protein